jgi:hypothetical protein|tara:strand:- start:208 stop:384 length:177 start_codon:yes stop_codon:yes gene_type:complete
MIRAIRAAMRYGRTLNEVLDLIEEIDGAIRPDGKISRDERSRILKHFWAVVKSIQATK